MSDTTPTYAKTFTFGGDLTVNRLGYGASGRPPGDGSCLGGQADTTHQVLNRLRAGTYRVDGTAPVPFRRLALAGHSGGGPVAQVAAYSFPGIDALPGVLGGSYVRREMEGRGHGLAAWSLRPFAAETVALPLATRALSAVLAQAKV